MNRCQRIKKQLSGLETPNLPDLVPNSNKNKYIKKKSRKYSSFHILTQRQKPKYSWEHWPYCTAPLQYSLTNLLCYLTWQSAPWSSRKCGARFTVALMNTLLLDWWPSSACASTDTEERYDLNFKGEEHIMTNMVQRKEEEPAFIARVTFTL